MATSSSIEALRLKNRYVYYGLTTQEARQPELYYRQDNRFTGKGVNLSLKGLQEFISDSNMGYLIPYYVRIPLSHFTVLDNVYYDPTYDMVTVKTPFKINLKRYKVRVLK